MIAPRRYLRWLGFVRAADLKVPRSTGQRPVPSIRPDGDDSVEEAVVLSSSTTHQTNCAFGGGGR